MSILNKYNIYINSKQRISGSSGDFTIQLEKPLLLTNSNNMFQAQIASLEYPYSWFQINSNNNTFVAKLYTGLTYTQQTVTVPEGNYNINTFLTTFFASIATAFSIPSIGILSTYDKNTGKVSMSWTDITYTGIEMLLSGTTIGKVLGFTTDVIVSITSGVVFSNTFVNVNPINYFVIRSDLVISNHDMECILAKTENSDILCKVPVRSSPNTFLFYSQPYDERCFLNVPIIDFIRFYVTPNDSRLILDNNGLDFSFTLTIYEVEKPVYSGHDKFENYIPAQTISADVVDQRDMLLKQLEEAKKNLQQSNVPDSANDAQKES